MNHSHVAPIFDLGGPSLPRGSLAIAEALGAEGESLAATGGTDLIHVGPKSFKKINRVNI